MQQLAAGIVTEFPHLGYESWSHSLGEALEWDGWTSGFVLHGLTYPIQCELRWSHVHTTPEFEFGLAEWLPTGDEAVTIWRGEPEELGDLHVALREAASLGFQRDEHCFTISMFGSRTTPAPSVQAQSGLDADENEIYECWFDWLEQQRIAPVRLLPGRRGLGFPISADQYAHLASQLKGVGLAPEALARALFASYSPAEELPGLHELADGDESERLDSDYWRAFYARRPRGHGAMSLSALGREGEEAALLISNFCGGDSVWQEQVFEAVESLGQGEFAAFFRRKDQGWSLRELVRLPLAWQCETELVARLTLHFWPRGRLRVVQRSQPGLNLHLRFDLLGDGWVDFQILDRGSLIQNQGACHFPRPVVLIPTGFSIQPALDAVESLLAET